MESKKTSSLKPKKTAGKPRTQKAQGRATFYKLGIKALADQTSTELCRYTRDMLVPIIRGMIVLCDVEGRTIVKQDCVETVFNIAKSMAVL